MDLIETIARRVRRQPSPDAKPTDALPPPATLDELADLHAKLLVERAAARELILSAPERRDELLDQPATDAQIKRLDRDVSAAHLTLERLDKAEPELLRQIQARQAETRAAAWYALRARVVTHLNEMAALRAALVRGEAGVLALKQEANRSGFDLEMQAVPWPHDFPRMVIPEQWAVLAHGIAQQPHLSRTSVQLWNVRFTDWTLWTPSGSMADSTAYMAGQEAGFNAATAWALVDAGRAEWPCPEHPATIAPRPPKPRHTRKPMTEAQRQNISGLRA